MSILPLMNVSDEFSYGGKAVQLGFAMRAGLPVPMGFGVSYQSVQEIVNNENEHLLNGLDEIISLLGDSCMVRSSAVGEDGVQASYAGIFRTELHLTNRSQILNAIRRVASSIHSDQANQYRNKMGVTSTPKMAVIIQQTVRADCSGVMFTRHPITHIDERIIESCWGLGESVVSGRIIPDQYRVNRGATSSQLVRGMQDTAIYTSLNGGTVEVELDDHLKDQASLNDNQVRQLDRLAQTSEEHFGAGLDLEWAFASNSLYLLQCRKMTT